MKKIRNEYKLRISEYYTGINCGGCEHDPLRNG